MADVNLEPHGVCDRCAKFVSLADMVLRADGVRLCGSCFAQYPRLPLRTGPRLLGRLLVRPRQTFRLMEREGLRGADFSLAIMVVFAMRLGAGIIGLGRTTGRLWVATPPTLEISHDFLRPPAEHIGAAVLAIVLLLPVVDGWLLARGPDPIGYFARARGNLLCLVPLLGAFPLGVLIVASWGEMVHLGHCPASTLWGWVNFAFTVALLPLMVAPLLLRVLAFRELFSASWPRSVVAVAIPSVVFALAAS